MALTSREQQKILRFLGWAGLTVVPDSTHFNSVVNDRLGNNVSKPLTVDIEREVRDILERLINIDTCLDEAKCRLTASQVDKITLNKNEISELRKERKRWIRELSDILDIPIMRSGFGSVKVIA